LLEQPTSSREDHDLICFSHLRWDSVFERPHHLMTRAARSRRVFVIEEPLFDGLRPSVETRRDDAGVTVVVPHLSENGPDTGAHLKTLLDFFLPSQRFHEYVAWYYTPMALTFSRHLMPLATVYDCMDELTALAAAPSDFRAAEQGLLARADLVLTNGHSLFEAKRHLNPNVHEFPSSVDPAHFSRARNGTRDPADQNAIPRPRIGFLGLLDERLDRELLADVAARTPGWHYILIGPIPKGAARALPEAPNLHHLGPKPYDVLPDYVAGWDVAMSPFVRNESTRYLNPTNTLEYLAAGKPIVSTSIAEVVEPYGDRQLVRIANTPEEFIDCIRAALCDRPAVWLPRVDAFLAGNSWDTTWSRISERLRAVLLTKRARQGRVGV
jgi:UDP-galactopyranose mutase